MQRDWFATAIAAVALLLGVVRPPPASSTVQVVEARRAVEDCSLAREEGYSSGVNQCPPPGYSLGTVLNAAVVGAASGYFLGPKLGLLRGQGAGSQVHVEAHINAGTGAGQDAFARGLSPKTLKNGGGRPKDA